MATRSYQYTITQSELEQARDASAILAAVSGVSRTAVKDAMTKGAVWLKRGKSQKRIRRATFKGLLGDQLSLHYNADILAQTPVQPTLLADEKQYSVWIKPAGLLAQGSPEGDHCALLRIVEQRLGRDVKLVHRLDREAAGVMLIAHTTKAAAAFSALFANAKGTAINKGYLVKVLGSLSEAGEITSPVDGKAALTRYRPTSIEAKTTWLEVDLITGRKHQIRRHFADLGYPVMGDPQYGQGNKDPNGLQLFAVSLSFTCPVTGLPRHYQWQPDQYPCSLPN